jgi:hypothetical protein
MPLRDVSSGRAAAKAASVTRFTIGLAANVDRLALVAIGSRPEWCMATKRRRDCVW